MDRRLRPFLAVVALLLGVALLGTSRGAKLIMPEAAGVVVNEGGNSLAIVDFAGGRVVAVHELGDVLDKPHLAAYDPAAGRLYVGNKGGNLAVFDLANPLAPKQIANVTPGEPTELHWIVLAGGLVWVADEGESSVYAYDPVDFGEPALRLGSDQGFDATHGIALRPGTDELWVTNRPKDAPGFILRIDAVERAVIGQPLQTTGAAGDRPNNVAFTADGRWAYAVNTGSEATQITVVDAEAFAVETQIGQDAEQGLAPHAIAFDPGTGRMFVANKDGGTVSAIDVATNTVTGYVAIGTEPHGVSVGPDGLVYATAKEANVVAVIDPGTLDLVAELNDPAFAGPHQVLFMGEKEIGRRSWHGGQRNVR